MNSIMRSSFFCLPIIGFLLLMMTNYTVAQGFAAPSPAPSSNDGSAIDQGIAYLLMLLALAVTYLAH